MTDFVLFKVDRDRGRLPRGPRGPGRAHGRLRARQVRAVTHYGITAADIDRTIAAVDAALRDTAPRPAGDPAASAA